MKLGNVFTAKNPAGGGDNINLLNPSTWLQYGMGVLFFAILAIVIGPIVSRVTGFVSGRMPGQRVATTSGPVGDGYINYQ